MRRRRGRSGGAPTPWRTVVGRTLLSLVVVLTLPGLAVMIDSAWTAATVPERRSVVRLADAGDAAAATYNPRSATVFLNGLGLDISHAQARALAPSIGRFGKVYALEYASVFDPNEAASALAGAVAPDPGQPVRLTVVTSSMGDVRGLEIIASLAQFHPEVAVDGFIVNTGPGPAKSQRVRGGDAVHTALTRACTPFVPGQLTMGIVEVVNQALQGLDVRDRASVRATFLSGTTYRGRVVMEQLCSLTRPSALDAPPWVPFTAYLSTGEPGDDVVVDVEGAYADWKRILPGMQLRRVAGATHDNFTHRPDLFNPLFADDLMPAVVATRQADEKPGRIAHRASAPLPR